MKKRILSVLILILALTACSNDEGGSYRTTNPGNVMANQQGVSTIAELDAKKLSKIQIKNLRNHSDVELDDPNLIKELCALLEGMAYSDPRANRNDDYEIRLLDSAENTIAAIVISGTEVTFESDITMNGKLIKKGTYGVGQWISDQIKTFSEGMIVDPAYIQYPAVLTIPDNLFYQQMIDHGSTKENNYITDAAVTNAAIYDLLYNKFCNKEFELLSSQRIYDPKAAVAEAERAKRESRCIVASFNASDTYLEIVSGNHAKQYVKTDEITLSENPDRKGTYSLITDRMILDIEAGSEFDSEFDAVFKGNRRVTEDLTPDDIKRLYDENRPHYMDYIFNNLGIEYRGMIPNKLEISTLILDKTADPYTVVTLYNNFDVILLIFEGGGDKAWRFIDSVDFGRKAAGNTYRLETFGSHVWFVGNRCRGYGTGEARYYQDWYEVTDEGKILVLSFPYDEYFEGYAGGYDIKAEDIHISNSGEMKIIVNYSITNKYRLNFTDRPEKLQMVSVSTRENVEFQWNEAEGCFISDYAVDESGATIIVPKKSEITKQCDEILENHYAELIKGLDGVESIADEITIRAIIQGLSKFLADCSDGEKKASLAEILQKKLTMD